MLNKLQNTVKDTNLEWIDNNGDLQLVHNLHGTIGMYYDMLPEAEVVIRRGYSNIVHDMELAAKKQKAELTRLGTFKGKTNFVLIHVKEQKTIKGIKKAFLDTTGELNYNLSECQKMMKLHDTIEQDITTMVSRLNEDSIGFRYKMPMR